MTLKFQPFPYLTVQSSNGHPQRKDNFHKIIFRIDKKISSCMLNTTALIPEDKDLNYRDIYWGKKPFAPNFPIACEPVFLNDRILAQKGKFTIHGDNSTAIEVLCEKVAKRIVLTGKCLPEALEFLEIANINEYSVFPDMSGIADYVRRAARLG